MTSNDYLLYFGEMMNSKINISNNFNKYYKDYSNIPDDSIIQYGNDWDENCDKKTFLKYQKKIIELKSFFRTNNFSPVEKLMIAYDIVKRKPYKLSSDESLNGLPHEVLFNEYISCRGYCNLLIEILNCEGIKIVNQSLDVFDKNQNIVDYHARCVVLLDDDKYNIHGLFIVSPTEDHYDEKNKTYLGNDLQSTDLYSWFLRPLRDKELYHDENYEYRIQDMETDTDILTSDGAISNNCYENPEYKLNSLLENNDLDELTILYDDVFHGLFDALPKEKILQYINTEYINFDLMLEIIKNVRKSMKYSDDQLSIEIDRISKVNLDFFPIDIKTNIKK